jgi:hypothetical protein
MTYDSEGRSYTIETRRLRVGPVGSALAADDIPAEQLAENIARALDQDDGWIHREGASWFWHPSRLAVELRCQRDPIGDPSLYIDTVVIDDADGTLGLFQWLNDLNVHSAGWWWWFDPTARTVHCSSSCAVRPMEWWWPSILLGVLPYVATVTESMADGLARVSNGTVHSFAHPGRGVRTSVDGWILGVRLGPREPTASLDLWLSDLELDRLDAALGVLCNGLAHRVQRPFEARIFDENNEPRVVLRRHWHPEVGWGWQLATFAGLTTDADLAGVDDLGRVASCLNAVQATDRLNRFGGWTSVSDLGLVHLTFIPAFEIEKLIVDAGPTIGDVAALMIDVGTRMRDVARALELADPPQIRHCLVGDEAVAQLPLINWKAGPIGWSYMDQEPDCASASTPETGPENEWLAPRHLLICSFGIFNPMGPTVSSLEAAFTARRGVEAYWRLFWVMRHPSAPEIEQLGAAPTPEALAELVIEALEVAEQGVFGSGPEWLDIHAMHDAVLAGAQRFAQVQSDVQWRAEADALVWYAHNPWARVSEHQPPVESAWPPEADSTECWIQAITDREVISGHQLYLRSAWEGAKAYRDSGWDPARAQSVADAIRRIAHERVEANSSFRGATQA